MFYNRMRSVWSFVYELTIGTLLIDFISTSTWQPPSTPLI